MTIKKLSAIVLGAMISCSVADTGSRNDDNNNNNGTGGSHQTPPPNNEETIVDGVSVKSGVTNENGSVFFTDYQTGEPVEVIITNEETNKPISGAKIGYFDGSSFEAFKIIHPSFQPILQIAAHNSDHAYSLTTAALPVLHDKNGKEENEKAAGEFNNWLKNNGDYHGCRSKEDIDSIIDTNASAMSYVISKISGYLTFGFSNYLLDIGSQFLKDQIDDNMAGHFFSYTGNTATTSISSLNIAPVGEEIPYNGIDDNCDGSIDEPNSSSSGSSSSSSSSSSTGSSSSSSSSGTGGTGSSSSSSSTSSGTGGAGGTPCQDECDYIGQMGCNGYYLGAPKECVADYDNDPCLEWEVDLDCDGIKKYCKCVNNYCGCSYNP